MPRNVLAPGAWVGRDTARSSDGGEPSGTAGIPILNAIAAAGASISGCKQGLIDTLVVVTRYKPPDAPLLGTGGLMRAYGSTARLVLRDVHFADAAPTTSTMTVQITIPVAHLGLVHALIARAEGLPVASGGVRRRGDQHFSSDGSEVRMAVEVATSHCSELLALIRAASGGTAVSLTGEP